ncbi:MAG: orotate phosphoribosyltransferase [bacterium]|nr:orotate phosphoribosyltransferase [bacterium]MDT8395737.1 orotate phosphoribosyltransferase [bacterium]
MDNNGLLEIFRENGGLLKGHFGLTSGRHSDTYLQCAQVLQHPELARRIGRELALRAAELFGEKGEGGVNLVVSPAVGGIVIGHEVAAALGVRAIFSERVGGEMTFRRGFAVQPGDRVLAVEDVVTTGGSIRETAELASASGGEVLATASIVHRYTEEPVAPTGLPHLSLLQVHALAYDPEGCPQCLEGIPVEKPGSRHLSPKQAL